MSGLLRRCVVIAGTAALAVATAVGGGVFAPATASACPTADASGISGTDVDWSGCVIDAGGQSVLIGGTSTINGATVENASNVLLGSVTAVGTSFANVGSITQVGAGDFTNAVFGSVTGAVTLTNAANVMAGVKFTGTYAGTISLAVALPSSVDFSGATFGASSKLALNGTFSGSNFSGVDLSGVGRGSINGSIGGATLTGAKLAGLDLTSLTSSCGIFGMPASLPAGWYLVGGCLTTTPPPPVYTISPFGAPVDPAPVVNTAKAGQTVPFKFRVTDATGAPISNLTSAATSVVAYACGGTQLTDSVETYATGNSGLQNLGGGAYQYNFKTDKSWAGSCRTLGITVQYASAQTARFEFVK